MAVGDLTFLVELDQVDDGTAVFTVPDGTGTLTLSRAHWIGHYDRASRLYITPTTSHTSAQTRAAIEELIRPHGR